MAFWSRASWIGKVGVATSLAKLRPGHMPSKRKRHDRTGRTVGDPKHVRLYRYMLNSEAWQALSLGARCLLIVFYDLYNGHNNGELFLSVREAARRLRVAPNTAARLLLDLQTKGFIRPNIKGGFDWKVRHATSWILTEFEFAGQLASKGFMRWRPSEELQKPASRIEADGVNRCDNANVKVA